MARGRLTGGPAWLVWGVVAVELGYVALSVVVAPDSVEMPTFARLIFALLVASLGIVGALIATRQPRNTIGWILWSAAIAMAWSIAGDDYVMISLSTAAGPFPATTAVAWLAGLPFLPALIMIMIFVPLLFPDGHLLSNRWRWVAALGILAVIVAMVPSAFMPGPLGADERIDESGRHRGAGAARRRALGGQLARGRHRRAAGHRLDLPALPARRPCRPGAAEVAHRGDGSHRGVRRAGLRADRSDRSHRLGRDDRQRLVASRSPSASPSCATTFTRSTGSSVGR